MVFMYTFFSVICYFKVISYFADYMQHQSQNSALLNLFIMNGRGIRDACENVGHFL